MIRTIFLAPPGAGKGTQAKKLAEVTGAIHVSTGDALRAAVSQKTAAGLKAKKYMDDGDLVPDKVVLQIVQDSLQQGAKTGWILDGFPRNEQQAIALEKILAKLKQKEYCVIYFEVPDSTLIERIAGRYTEGGRNDDEASVVPNRLRVYREQTSPLIEFYTQRKILKSIDGSRSVDVIFEEIQDILKEFKM
jgi:adenylate kinase